LCCWQLRQWQPHRRNHTPLWHNLWRPRQPMTVGRCRFTHSDHTWPPHRSRSRSRRGGWRHGCHWAAMRMCWTPTSTTGRSRNSSETTAWRWRASGGFTRQSCGNGSTTRLKLCKRADHRVWQIWRLWCHCCHMGTAMLKHPVPDRVKLSCVIFDIRALWRSGLSVRVPGCQKLQIMA